MGIERRSPVTAFTAGASGIRFTPAVKGCGLGLLSSPVVESWFPAGKSLCLPEMGKAVAGDTCLLLLLYD